MKKVLMEKMEEIMEKKGVPTADISIGRGQFANWSRPIHQSAAANF